MWSEKDWSNEARPLRCVGQRVVQELAGRLADGK